MSTAIQKNELRQRMKAVLAGQDEHDAAVRTARIITLLQQRLEWFEPGAVVSLFGGLPGEPDLSPMLAWMVERGCLPVLFQFNSGELVPRVVRGMHDMERGAFGAWVPRDQCRPARVDELDLILTPGLAFDRSGCRLGRGRGYFDRLFVSSDSKALRLGVCFACQVIEAVPCEPHDARVGGLATETSVEIFR